MIRESLQTSLALLGSSIGLVAGLAISREIAQDIEMANAEVAYTLTTSDELQDQIDARFEAVGDELTRLETWLGQGCLILMRQGANNLDSVDDLVSASECDVPPDIREQTITLYSRLFDQQQILYRYQSREDDQSQLDRLVVAADEVIEDSRETSILEALESDHTNKVIAVKFEDSNIVEIQERNFRLGYSVTALLFAAGQLTGYFVGRRADLRLRKKIDEERNEKARIDIEVDDFVARDIKLLDKHPKKFWDRMTREE